MIKPVSVEELVKFDCDTAFINVALSKRLSPADKECSSLVMEKINEIAETRGELIRYKLRQERKSGDFIIVPYSIGHEKKTEIPARK